MTRPLGAAAGGARAGRSPCAARRTPLSALPAPNSRTQQRHLSAHSSPTRAVTRWQAARTPFSAGLAAGLPDQLRKGGEEWEGLDPDHSLRQIGNQPFLRFQRGCQKKIKIKQQRSSPKRRSDSCHLKHASSNQHIFIERLWYALALF